MSKNKIASINGVQFEYVQIPSKEAMKLFIKVSNMVGPLLGKLSKLKLNELKEGSLDKEIPEELLVVFGEILSGLKEDDIEFLRSSFAEYSLFLAKDGNNKILKNVMFFEECFGGDPIFMFKWMISFIKTNFLGGLSGLIK